MLNMHNNNIQKKKLQGGLKYIRNISIFNCVSQLFCIINCSVHDDINNNDHESTSNFDDLDRRNETILLLVPVLSRGLVHTKLSDVSTEQQIIAEWSDSCNNKKIKHEYVFCKKCDQIVGCVHGATTGKGV